MQVNTQSDIEVAMVIGTNGPDGEIADQTETVRVPPPPHSCCKQADLPSSGGVLVRKSFRRSGRDVFLRLPPLGVVMG